MTRPLRSLPADASPADVATLEQATAAAALHRHLAATEAAEAAWEAAELAAWDGEPC